MMENNANDNQSDASILNDKILYDIVQPCIADALKYIKIASGFVCQANNIGPSNSTGILNCQKTIENIQNEINAYITLYEERKNNLFGKNENGSSIDGDRFISITNSDGEVTQVNAESIDHATAEEMLATYSFLTAADQTYVAAVAETPTDSSLSTGTETPPSGIQVDTKTGVVTIDGEVAEDWDGDIFSYYITDTGYNRMIRQYFETIFSNEPIGILGDEFYKEFVNNLTIMGEDGTITSYELTEAIMGTKAFKDYADDGSLDLLNGDFTLFQAGRTENNILTINQYFNRCGIEIDVRTMEALAMSYLYTNQPNLASKLCTGNDEFAVESTFSLNLGDDSHTNSVDYTMFEAYYTQTCIRGFDVPEGYYPSYYVRFYKQEDIDRLQEYDVLIKASDFVTEDGSALITEYGTNNNPLPEEVAAIFRKPANEMTHEDFETLKNCGYVACMESFNSVIPYVIDLGSYCQIEAKWNDYGQYHERVDYAIEYTDWHALGATEENPGDNLISLLCSLTSSVWFDPMTNESVSYESANKVMELLLSGDYNDALTMMSNYVFTTNSEYYGMTCAEYLERKGYTAETIAQYVDYETSIEKKDYAWYEVAGVTVLQGVLDIGGGVVGFGENIFDALISGIGWLAYAHGDLMNKWFGNVDAIIDVYNNSLGVVENLKNDGWFYSKHSTRETIEKIFGYTFSDEFYEAIEILDPQTLMGTDEFKTALTNFCSNGVELFNTQLGGIDNHRDGLNSHIENKIVNGELSVETLSLIADLVHCNQDLIFKTDAYGNVTLSSESQTYLVGNLGNITYDDDTIFMLIQNDVILDYKISSVIKDAPTLGEYLGLISMQEASGVISETYRDLLSGNLVGGEDFFYLDTNSNKARYTESLYYAMALDIMNSTSYTNLIRQSVIGNDSVTKETASVIDEFGEGNTQYLQWVESTVETIVGEDFSSKLMSLEYFGANEWLNERGAMDGTIFEGIFVSVGEMLPIIFLTGGTGLVGKTVSIAGKSFTAESVLQFALIFNSAYGKTFESTYYDSRFEGASLHQRFFYSAISGTIEATVEGINIGGSGIGGSGILKQLKGINVFKNPGKWGKVFFELARAGHYEGVEEIISGILEPFNACLILHHDEAILVDDLGNYIINGEFLEDYFSGFMASMILTTGSVTFSGISEAINNHNFNSYIESHYDPSSGYTMGEWMEMAHSVEQLMVNYNNGDAKARTIIDLMGKNVDLLKAKVGTISTSIEIRDAIMSANSVADLKVIYDSLSVDAKIDIALAEFANLYMYRNSVFGTPTTTDMNGLETYNSLNAENKAAVDAALKELLPQALKGDSSTLFNAYKDGVTITDASGNTINVNVSSMMDFDSWRVLFNHFLSVNEYVITEGSLTDAEQIDLHSRMEEATENYGDEEFSPQSEYDKLDKSTKQKITPKQFVAILNELLMASGVIGTTVATDVTTNDTTTDSSTETTDDSQAEETTVTETDNSETEESSSPVIEDILASESDVEITPITETSESVVSTITTEELIEKIHLMTNESQIEIIKFAVSSDGSVTSYESMSESLKSSISYEEFQTLVNQSNEVVQTSSEFVLNSAILGFVDFNTINSNTDMNEVYNALPSSLKSNINFKKFAILTLTAYANALEATGTLSYEEIQLIKNAASYGMTLKDLGSQKASEDLALTKYTEEAEKLASKLWQDAAKYEASITADMKALQVDGTELKGLDNVLKSPESIARKLLNKFLEELNYDPSYARKSAYKTILKSKILEIKDSVRYTFILSEANYVNQMSASLWKLLAKGYTIQSFKNFWGDSVYQGVNVTLASPDGIFIELQFHTETSYNTKETINHSFYEIVRNSYTTPNQKNLANIIMIQNQSKVNVPAMALGYQFTMPAGKALPSTLAKAKMINNGKIVSTDVAIEYAYNHYFNNDGGVSVPDSMRICNITELNAFPGNTYVEKIDFIKSLYGEYSPMAISAIAIVQANYIELNPSGLDKFKTYGNTASFSTSDADAISDRINGVISSADSIQYSIFQSQEACENYFKSHYEALEKAKNAYTALNIESVDFREIVNDESLSVEVRAYAAIRLFTSEYYTEITKVMRTGKGNSTAENAIKILSKYMSDFTLDQPVILFRGIYDLEFLFDYYKIDSSLLKTDGSKESLAYNLSLLAGGSKVLCDNSFISTTPVFGQGFTGMMDIIEVIKAPAGTQGMFVGKYSTCSTECEFTINAGEGNRMVIENVEMVGNQIFVYTNIVSNEVSDSTNVSHKSTTTLSSSTTITADTISSTPESVDTPVSVDLNASIDVNTIMANNVQITTYEELNVYQKAEIDAMALKVQSGESTVSVYMEASIELKNSISYESFQKILNEVKNSTPVNSTTVTETTTKYDELEVNQKSEFDKLVQEIKNGESISSVYNKASDSFKSSVDLNTFNTLISEQDIIPAPKVVTKGFISELLSKVIHNQLALDSTTAVVKMGILYSILSVIGIPPVLNNSTLVINGIVKFAKIIFTQAKTTALSWYKKVIGTKIDTFKSSHALFYDAIVGTLKVAGLFVGLNIVGSVVSNTMSSLSGFVTVDSISSTVNTAVNGITGVFALSNLIAYGADKFAAFAKGSVINSVVKTIIKSSIIFGITFGISNFIVIPGLIDMINSSLNYITVELSDFTTLSSAQISLYASSIIAGYSIVTSALSAIPTLFKSTVSLISKTIKNLNNTINKKVSTLFNKMNFVKRISENHPVISNLLNVVLKSSILLGGLALLSNTPVMNITTSFALTTLYVGYQSIKVFFNTVTGKYAKLIKLKRHKTINSNITETDTTSKTATELGSGETIESIENTETVTKQTETLTSEESIDDANIYETEIDNKVVDNVKETEVIDEVNLDETVKKGPVTVTSEAKIDKITIDKTKSSFSLKNFILTNINKIAVITFSTIAAVTPFVYVLEDREQVEKGKEFYLKLLGSNNVALIINNEYREPGYQAYDPIDGDLTNKVIVTGKVDNSKIGVYVLTYTVTNSKEITLSKTRIINIVNSIAPITEDGDDIVIVEESHVHPIKDPDNSDGDPVDEIPYKTIEITMRDFNEQTEKAKIYDGINMKTTVLLNQYINKFMLNNRLVYALPITSIVKPNNQYQDIYACENNYVNTEATGIIATNGMLERVYNGDNNCFNNHGLFYFTSNKLHYTNTVNATINNEIVNSKTRNTFVYEALLVDNGQIMNNDEKVTTNSAICQSGNNTLKIFTYDKEVHYVDIANMMIKNGCQTGLLLTNGTSSIYKSQYSNTLNIRHGIDGDTDSIIIFYERS